jgi:hypothetical protein
MGLSNDSPAHVGFLAQGRNRGAPLPIDAGGLPAKSSQPAVGGRRWRMMRCSPEWASCSEVLDGGEEVSGGADKGSSMQLIRPERDDMAR